MTDCPIWLLFGTLDETPIPSAFPGLLVEFHQPLHYVICDQNADGLSVVVFDKSAVTPEELAYIEKTRNLITTKHTSGKFARPADYRPPPVGTMPSGRMCDLCELAHYTPWYAEFHLPLRFTILDCDACDVPIAVLGEHRTELTGDEVAFMEEALNMVAEQKYTGKFPKWMFDHNMRQIPDHYHLHVRPLLW